MDGERPDLDVVHELFEAQVIKTPAAMAVIGEGVQLSFGELNRRANRLAHRLRSLGVRPEVVVGVHLQRSPVAVAAVMGVIKTGGAYHALDPAYPEERLRFMLEDSRASVVVTSEEMSGRLAVAGPRLVSVDRDGQASGQSDHEDLGARTLPDHLLYVTYTVAAA